MSSIRPNRAIGRALITAGGLALLAAVYERLLFARSVNRGGSPDEVRSRLRGDERLEDAEMVATRAVTVDASAAAISRNRARVRTASEHAGTAAIELGSSAMERKMLRGIKERAEQGAGESPQAPPNQAN